MNLKELKKQLKSKTDKDPDKYYATSVLKNHDFSRKQCSNCGKFFWSVNEKNICGEPECEGTYSFIGNSPSKQKMDFIGVWDRFSKMFKKLGYEPIRRYPVVARWREDVYWNNASIYDFQPHVVTGRN